MGEIGGRADSNEQLSITSSWAGVTPSLDWDPGTVRHSSAKPCVPSPPVCVSPVRAQGPGDSPELSAELGEFRGKAVQGQQGVVFNFVPTARSLLSPCTVLGSSHALARPTFASGRSPPMAWSSPQARGGRACVCIRPGTGRFYSTRSEPATHLGPLPTLPRLASPTAR